jgi:hypothetical protein
MEEHQTSPHQHPPEPAGQQPYFNPPSSPNNRSATPSMNNVGQGAAQFPTGMNQPPQGWAPIAQTNMPQQQPGQPNPYLGQAIQTSNTPEQRHEVPKCLSCGTITPWKVEPILLPRHIIIFLILLLFFGTGLIYLIIILIIRSGSNSRSKICPHCGARNLWTFLY